MRKSFLLVTLFLFTGIFAMASTTISKELPVKFIRFYAQQVGEDVRMRWITESEYNNDFFTVERSKDMTAWESLEIVPGSEISPGAGQYEFFDTEPLQGMNYYRIRQTDLNGVYDHSHVEKVDMQALADEIAPVVLAPNPVSMLGASFTAKSKTTFQGASVKMTDISGKEALINVDINDTEMTITPFIRTPGLYFLVIRKGNHSIVKKIKIE
jgi:fibronectin-binding autotransporter adhesin